MGSMPSGGGGGVYSAPPPIVYQSTDPYAANYKPPTGPQLSAAQKAATSAKVDATPLAPAGDDADELERRRRLALILGSGAETWGGGDGSSSGAADAGAGDSSGAADGSAY